MRTRRAAPVGRLTAVLLTLAVVLTGCGGDPTPRAWAASVCQALTPWRAEIRNLTSSTSQQMTARTTPAQAKDNLVRLMGGAEQASEAARRAVQEAGTPDVPDGDRIAGSFVVALASVRDAYGRARTSIEALGTGEPAAFYDGVKAAVDRLNSEYDASGLDASRLNSEELKRAFDEVPECL